MQAFLLRYNVFIVLIKKVCFSLGNIYHTLKSIGTIVPAVVSSFSLLPAGATGLEVVTVRPLPSVSPRVSLNPGFDSKIDIQARAKVREAGKRKRCWDTTKNITWKECMGHGPSIRKAC